MMWEAVQRLVQLGGHSVYLNTPIVKLCHDHSRIEAAVVQTHLGQRTVTATHFLSSAPLQQLIRMLDPPPPDPILKAADALCYRDFISVNLIVNRRSLFPDNWIYVHSPHARVARVQNYKNWSAPMVPDPNTTSLGMEYFCSQGDELWSLSSEGLIELAKKDLKILNLAKPHEIADGFVIRETKAYPVYNGDFQKFIAMIRGYLARIANLQTMGRNGLHKYNNQDHSMLCARYAVENVFGANRDIWEVNTEKEYQESRKMEGPADLKEA